MTEKEDALKLAERILDRPYGDPDDDLAVLSRQLVKATERKSRADYVAAVIAVTDRVGCLRSDQYKWFALELAKEFGWDLTEKELQW